MDISIWKNERSVDCIRCLECTACPVVSYKTVFETLPAMTITEQFRAGMNPAPTSDSVGEGLIPSRLPAPAK
jgi:hypothetical protein